MTARKLGLVAVAASLLIAMPVSAFVLSEDEIEDTGTDAGVIVRNFDFVLGGKTLEPPRNTEDASPAASSVLDVRTYLSYRSSHLRLVWHQSTTSTVRSHSSLGLLDLGRSTLPPRWLPLRAEDKNGSTLQLGTETDWAYLALVVGRTTVTLGRQPVTLGRGRLFHPSDLVSQFSLTEVDTEYKPGVDGARVDFSPDSSTTLTAVAAGGERERDHDLGMDRKGSSTVLQVKRGWDHGEFSALGAWVRNDLVLGYGALFDLGALDLYGEITVTWLGSRSLSAPAVQGRHAPVLRALSGMNLHPVEHLTVIPEVYYDGFGAQRASDYLAVATSERVAVGEQVTFGRLYAGAVADWEADPTVHVTLLGLSNVLDPSGLLSASVSYDAAANTRLVLGGYLPLGPLPRVGPVPQPRSEYGSYPWFGYAELRVVL